MKIEDPEYAAWKQKTNVVKFTEKPKLGNP